MPYILCDNRDEFTAICASLVREGITFRAYAAGEGTDYRIELTGGY